MSSLESFCMIRNLIGIRNTVQRMSSLSSPCHCEHRQLVRAQAPTKSEREEAREAEGERGGRRVLVGLVKRGEGWYGKGRGGGLLGWFGNEVV